MTSNNKKSMHKTIQEINLGLSNLNLVVDAQNPFETFKAVRRYLDEIQTIEYSAPKLDVAEYLGKNEDCLIRLNREDWRLMLSKYCCDGQLWATLKISVELRDAHEIKSGWCVYKFEDITLEKLKSALINL